MNNDRNIIIFSGYHLPHLGGVERYTDNLAIQLSKMGWDVTIVSSNFDDTEYMVVIHGILNYKIPIQKLFRTRYPIPKKNAEYKKIMSAIDQKKYQAVICNTRFFLTSLLGAKYAKKCGIPCFVIEHGSQHLTVDNKVLDFFGALYEHGLTKILKKYADYYYGVSQEACRWQKHFGISSDGVWYNAINDFYDVDKLNKTFDGKIIFTYAGRVLKQKGVYELLDAFEHLSKRYPQIELHIAGAGNQLETAKEKYSGNPQIVFEGKLAFKDLVELYSKTHVFVYAPLWPEGLPTSILEAGYMGCACIASPQGGIKEIIQDGENGLMITSQAELETAMEKLIRDKKRRKQLADALQQTVMEKFRWENVSIKIEQDISGSQEKH